MYKKFLTFLLPSLLLISCSGEEEEWGSDVKVPVSVMEVKKGDIEELVTSTGTVKPRAEAAIFSEVSGAYYLADHPVAQRKMKEGDRVERGWIIARLENEELVVSARSESKRLTMEAAKREFEKQEKLYEKGGVTLSELETARRNMVDAEFNYRASVLQLDKLNIKSPISGVITYLNSATDGIWLSSGTEIARIMDYSWVELYLNIPAGDIQQISIGQAVKVTNYSIPDRWFRGEVTEISPTIDPQSRAFTVKVTVKNTDLTLKPGMFVKANVVVRKKTGTIVIPRYAVQSRDDTHIVFIVQKQRAKVREIKKGLEDRENVEVLEGLETGERLVVKGFESLRDGVKVKVSG